jgi:hypothetical protein
MTERNNPTYPPSRSPAENTRKNALINQMNRDDERNVANF